MKRIIFLFLLAGFVVSARAQTITRIEYAIDSDPGYSLANQLIFTPDSNLSLTAALDFSGLNPGVHILFFRAMDDSNHWGNTIAKPIFVDAFLPQDILMAEYFIDTDPGFGNGIQVSLTPGLHPVKVFSMDVGGLATGMHIIYVRVKDASGQWSITHAKIFFKEGNSSGNITQLEYYFDNDPGFGMGTPVALTPGTNVENLFDVNYAGLEPGLHHLFVRAKNEAGAWSVTYNHDFYITSIKAYLEGLYNPDMGNMNKAMGATGYRFGGDTAEIVSVKLLTDSSPPVELFQFDNISVNQDGYIFIPVNPAGSYTLALTHRNSIETWGSVPILTDNASAGYDFTMAAEKAYGNNLKEINGVYAVYAGDVNQDHRVDALDLIETDNQSVGFQSGYLPADANGDGLVNTADLTMISNNANSFASARMPVLLPAVSTGAVSNITQTTATSGGNVTFDGGGTITVRGVCWGTFHDPAISDSHTTDGNSTGSFSSSLTDLTANTLYYVRAYATNSAGTKYGNEVSFTTLPIAGLTCGESITINHVEGMVAPVNKSVTYGIVGNVAGETSKCWITSNLGATNQATALNDATEPSAGWYWQFNRKQGYKHDGSTRTPNTTWITSINENLYWQAANDPCTLELGSGWRVPTSTEWANVDATGLWDTGNGPWNSLLKLHAAGRLDTSSGSISSRGLVGCYWSQTPIMHTHSHYLYFSSGECYMDYNFKAFGYSIRCISE